ncbi:isotrichodermin C-15 hydroxylase [Colletotrichum truncatum]|uniref:Isotrichodermin C-15 hydroxylase n=1 Tax=Colletotrichum truncatum TaxID=5467 RepID=A0ACC3ZGQ1_COLTU|nr:isotrichodermin C-15 hydroxylase [Colletotrichum truncatum]KAF6784695.1 isotrichodermin C-15 hydroxylase [Colletotrichum truncatum]
MPLILLRAADTMASLAGLAFGVLVAWFASYVIYQRYLHPLAAFPSPFLASLTDLWQVQQVLSLKEPYNLTDLHAKYGEFVRYGPDKLSVTAEDAVPLVYVKGGRKLPKTKYYEAFGSHVPNVFSMRDVDLHSVRRRHMSNSFSLSSAKGMERYLDENIRILRGKIAKYAKEGKAFDLRKLVQFYVVDVLGELAFSRSFGVQISGDESLVPPVFQHTLLGTTVGSWPAMLHTLKKWLPKVPHKGLQALIAGRMKCVRLASECVQRRVDEVEKEGAGGKGRRTDLLTTLILARHPDTGEKLKRVELETEAFGFIIAGTHTTSATINLLFWNLLHNPEHLQKCVLEIDEKLDPLGDDKEAYSITEAEGSLPFLRACMRENFRITPVFTMPLPRRVAAPEGITIAGRHIKQGTSVAVCNHAFHHNPAVWGDDHDTFDPFRWEEAETAERARYLMHFGLGSRQCLGKTMAQSNIYKVTSTLLREFEFQLADPKEREEVSEGKFKGVLPELISVGVSALRDPLMVVAKIRDTA